MYRMSIMALTCLSNNNIINKQQYICCNCNKQLCCSSLSTSVNDSTSILPVNNPNCDDNIDILRAIQISLVHDLAESLVGDITPTQYSGITKQQKSILERDAMNKIKQLLNQTYINNNNDISSSVPGNN